MKFDEIKRREEGDQLTDQLTVDVKLQILLTVSAN